MFRDESDFTGTEYRVALERNLRASSKLLLICSPHSRTSSYVAGEVELFARHRGAEHMVTALLAGVPNNEATRDQAEVKAFPDSLLTLLPNPLAAEYRGFDPKKHRVDRGPFESAWYKLLADLYQDYGLSREQLEQRERRRQARRRSIVTSVTAAIAILMTGLAGVALWQRGVARQQEMIARQNEAEAMRQRDLALSRQLRSDAERLKGVDGQWATAVLLGIESVRRAASPEAHAVLWELAASGAVPVARVVANHSVGPVAFTPDSQALAMSVDDSVVMLQARGGRELGRVPLSGLARFIAFDPTGGRLVVQTDESIRIFEVASGRETERLDDGARPVLAGFSADGQVVAMATGRLVRLLDVFTGRPIATVEHAQPVRRLHPSPAGTHVALQLERGLALVDTTTGQRHDLPERTTPISAVSFSADGTLVAVASHGPGEEVAVFDTATGRQVRGLPPSSRAWFGPLGSVLVTAPASAALLVHDVRRGLDVGRLSLRGAVGAVGWSRDGELLVAGTGEQDGSTTVFQTGSWRRLARLTNRGMVGVGEVSVSPDGRLVATRGSRFLTVFEAHHGRSIVRLDEPGGPGRIAFSPDGGAVAVAVEGGGISLFAADTGRRLQRLGSCDRPRSLALSLGGSVLAVGCPDGQVRLFDVARGATTGEVTHRSTTPPVLSRDGRSIFAVGDQGASVFETAGGRAVRVIGGDSVSAVALSPRGDRVAIAAGGPSGASVIDVAGDRRLAGLSQDELIESVAFSLDGARVAVGGRSRFARVYEVDTGRIAARLDHKEEEKGVLRMRALAFSASGDFLASVVVDPTVGHGGTDSTVRVFHTRLGQEIVRIPLRDQPHFVRFSPDDAYLELAVGRRDIRLERYPLGVDGLVREACSRIGRNLTELEWARYLGSLPYRATCAQLNEAAADP